MNFCQGPNWPNHSKIRSRSCCMVAWTQGVSLSGLCTLRQSGQTPSLSLPRKVIHFCTSHKSSVACMIAKTILIWKVSTPCNKMPMNAYFWGVKSVLNRTTFIALRLAIQDISFITSNGIGILMQIKRNALFNCNAVFARNMNSEISRSRQREI